MRFVEITSLLILFIVAISLPRIILPCISQSLTRIKTLKFTRLNIVEVIGKERMIMHRVIEENW